MRVGVVSTTLALVDAPRFGARGSEVQIFSPRPIHVHDKLLSTQCAAQFAVAGTLRSVRAAQQKDLKLSKVSQLCSLFE